MQTMAMLASELFPGGPEAIPGYMDLGGRIRKEETG